MDTQDTKNQTAAADTNLNDELRDQEISIDELAQLDLDNAASDEFSPQEIIDSLPSDNSLDTLSDISLDEPEMPEISEVPLDLPAEVSTFETVSGDDLSKMAQSFGDRKANLSNEVNSDSLIQDLEEQIKAEINGEAQAVSYDQQVVTDPLSDLAKEVGFGPDEILENNFDQEIASDLGFNQETVPDPIPVFDQEVSQALEQEITPVQEQEIPPTFNELVAPNLDEGFQVRENVTKLTSNPTSATPEFIPAPVVEQESISALESSIQADLIQSEEQLAAENNTKLGIGSTYYTDLNSAMGSNEPAIMSELLRKAEFEEKEKSILSPTSKKNLPYIIGAIILILASVAAWFFLFSRGDDEVTYITDERVKSLVYSDQDLGINTTGLEVFQTKSAIRKLIERKQDRDTLSQVYYVKEDENRMLRRIGVKDVFTSTDAQIPTLLYDNIQHDFMHGIYTTDKNYPFMILKAVSYDRAFEGMKQWEPNMIDDMATYFDLPKEATDRSLLEDGFSDNLIKNKNVRVARYVPRSKDRGLLNFLGITGGDETAETPDTPETDVNAIQGGTTATGEELTPTSPSPFGETPTNPSPFGETSNKQASLKEALIAFLTKPFMTSFAFAQGTNTGVGGVFIDNTLGSGNSELEQTVCYKATRKCINLQTGQALPGTSTSSATTYCYQDLIDPNNPGKTYTPSEITGNPNDYICRKVLTGGTSVNLESTTQLSSYYTKPICFDPLTGNRLPPTPETPANSTGAAATTTTPPDTTDLCFIPYQCRRIACTQAGQEVPSSYEGRPGVSCKTTDDVVDINSTEKKSCIQFTELLTLKNINNMNLCFDENGRYVPVDNRVQTLGDFYASDQRTQNQSVNQLLQSSAGLTCITPTTRYQRLCVTDGGKVVPGVGENKQLVQVGANVGGDRVAFCFEPTPANGVYEQFESSNYNIREKAAQASVMLRQAANVVGVLGAVGGFLGDIVGTTESFRADMQSFRTTLNETADIMWQVSTQDLLNIQLPQDCAESSNPNCIFEDNRIDILYKVAAVTRRVEIVLDGIKRYIPNAEGTQAVQKIREVIDFIKRAFGLKNNITWITIGNQLPQGIDIYPGDPLSSGSGIDAVQLALVQLGLLDPLSATGELDLVTQQAISALQAANGLPVALSIDQTYLSSATLQLLAGIVQSAEGLYGEGTTASIDDFFAEPSQLGSFSKEVQMLQVILYVNGYNISSLDGVFDGEVCSALQSYQVDNNLEIADPTDCKISQETMDHLNGHITENNYLGSGFEISTNGALQGTGKFLGKAGPGAVDFAVNNAEAQGLQEGDVILMYTFLDEETILITTHESVITEIIRRRALNNIFNE